jgi:hypothetical protein
MVPSKDGLGRISRTQFKAPEFMRRKSCQQVLRGPMWSGFSGN